MLSANQQHHRATNYFLLTVGILIENKNTDHRHLQDYWNFFLKGTNTSIHSVKFKTENNRTHTKQQTLRP